MTLKKFLQDKAAELHPALFDREQWRNVPGPVYREDVSEQALTEAWLAAGASYIWKVGIWLIVDPNKCWVYLFLGHQRRPGYPPEFIGELHWRSGENDDIGRCLQRMIALAKAMNPVFE